MQFFNLTQKLRDALDEPALQLLENYDAEIMEAVPPSFDSTELTELWEYVNKHTASTRLKIGYDLTSYCETGSGTLALLELTQNLQPAIAGIKSALSGFKKAKRLEIGTKRLEEELSKPLGILKLDSTIIAVLYPHAQERFNNWKEELNKEVPELEELTTEQIVVDINDNLDDDEKNCAAKYETTIKDWLSKCVDSGGKEFNSAAYDRLYSMIDLKALLREVYKRKKVKAEEEVRKAEEKARDEEYWERWRVAYIAIKPPDDDAKKYLKEEYDKFEKASWEAIDIYMEKGEDYLHDSRTFEYRWYLDKINKEKEKEQILNDAKAQATAFGANLEQRLKEVEKLLSTKKKDPKVFFSNWCSNNGEKRYQEEPFTDILASDNFRDRNWTQGYSQPAEDRLGQSIPREFRNFILMKPTVVFFLLPSADYGYYGVPCLNIYFDVFAVVTITVLAQAWHKVFNGYKFNFLTDLRDPKLPGFYHITITPSEPHFWQSVPLTILYALMAGKFKASGTTIMHRSKEETIYKVKKFDDDICEIPISVECYWHSLGSIDKMKELGIINERTAEMLEFPQPISNDHKQGKSKKAKALEYFSQGKRPSDPEVKALGIKATSAYRYYQGWKRATTVANST